METRQPHSPAPNVALQCVLIAYMCAKPAIISFALNVTTKDWGKAAPTAIEQMFGLENFANNSNQVRSLKIKNI